SSLSCPATSTTDIPPLSLHDALPIYGDRDALQRPDRAARPAHPVVRRRLPWHHLLRPRGPAGSDGGRVPAPGPALQLRPRPGRRSEEHTSELQSRENLVCRLLLEKKK